MKPEYDKIREHIKRENAKTIAWVNEDPDNRWAMVGAEDAIIDTLRKYSPDVVTLDDYIRYELWNVYYDAFKDVHGFRPRWTHWKDHSEHEWREELIDLRSEAEALIWAEQRAEEERKAAEARPLDTSIGDAFISQHLPL